MVTGSLSASFPLSAVNCCFVLFLLPRHVHVSSSSGLFVHWSTAGM